MSNTADAVFFERLCDAYFPPDDPHRKDPVGWVRDVLGEQLWSGQAKMIESTTKFRKTVVKAAHSVGKTRGLSRLVLWWVSVHPIGEALVVITSDNDDNIKGGVWREVIAAHAKAGLPGKVTLDAKWHAGPNNQTLVAFGRKPADTNPTGLQGLHAKYILVIIDECAGVPAALWDACESLASNKNGVILAVGNPTDPNSHFAEVCKPGSTWEVQQISAFDTPAYTGEEVPETILENLVDPVWVEERKKVYGIGSPMWCARVLGEFPEVGNDSLIQPKWIEAAQKRKLDRTWKPRMAWDIARFGEDETIGYRREGGWVRLQRAHSKTDTMVTAGHILKARNDINSESRIEAWTEIVVDEDGVGGGVIDRLREQDVDVVGFRGGLPAYDPTTYFDRRSELYWMLRQEFEAGEIDIDELDDVLAAQLGNIKWTVDSKGRIKVETKKEMRKRGVPSPDRADAVMMTLQDCPIVQVEEEVGASQTLTGDLLTKRF